MKLSITARIDGQTSTATISITDQGVAVQTGGPTGDDLTEAIAEANETVHGGIEPWVPVVNYLQDWAEDRSFTWVLADEPERTPVDPDVVY